MGHCLKVWIVLIFFRTFLCIKTLFVLISFRLFIHNSRHFVNDVQTCKYDLLVLYKESNFQVRKDCVTSDFKIWEYPHFLFIFLSVLEKLSSKNP